MNRSRLLVPAVLVAGGLAGAQTVETFTLENPRVAPAPKPAFQPWSAAEGLDLALLPAIVLGTVDEDALAAEDAQRESGANVPQRYGIVRGTPLRAEDGVWHELDGGRWLWTGEVRAVGARSLRVHLTRVDLPRGAELAVFAPRPAPGVAAREPERYTGRGPGDSGEAWTPTIFGDRARVECLVPAQPGVPPELPFTVDALLHDYRSTYLELVAGGPCYVDSSCVAGISTLRRAVGRIDYIENGGGYRCSGQLLQTTAVDFTPYFQTANHCIATNAVANTAEIFWLFQSGACDATPPTLDSVPSSTYCTLMATQASSDSTLLLVEGTLPAGLAWAGWTTAIPFLGTPGVSIHHPQGTFKKASTGIYVPGFDCGGSTDHFSVSYSQGSMDNGSSGGGFFLSASQQFVGQCHCGVPCETVIAFGRFADFHPLVATRLAVGPDDSFENNDSCGGLPDIAEGTYGNLVVKDVDDDWYEILVPAGAKLTVDLSFTHAWGDVDARLWVNCGDSTWTDSSTSTTNAERLEWVNTTGSANTVAWNVFLFSDERNGYTMTVSLDPGNDTCASAQLVTDNVTVVGTNVNATSSTTAACDTGSGHRDVWYRYTASQTGTLQVRTLDSGLDTVVTVYDGCGGAQLGCNDDALVGSPYGYGTPHSYLDVPVLAGQDCRIRVSGYAGLVGWFELRLDTDSGAPYCLGDGISGLDCPCSNASSTALEAGCLNSTGAAGRLVATGLPDVSGDTLVLQGSGMPANSTCLYFQGSAKQSSGAGSSFGDGLRCATGSVIRLGTKTNSASGTSSYPGAGDADVSVRGFVPVGGGTRYYQCWYRNSAAYCTSATFNLTNGYRIDWRP